MKKIDEIKTEVKHVMDDHYGTVYCLVMVVCGIAACTFWLCKTFL